MLERGLGEVAIFIAALLVELTVFIIIIIIVVVVVVVVIIIIINTRIR